MGNPNGDGEPMPPLSRLPLLAPAVHTTCTPTPHTSPANPENTTVAMWGGGEGVARGWWWKVGGRKDW